MGRPGALRDRAPGRPRRAPGRRPLGRPRRRLRGWTIVGRRSGRRDSGVDGLTVVDKPAEMTSHDVVARIRRIANTRRVGHGGTLDPMATGVLVVAFGRATRLLTFVSGSDKAYTATIRLGVATVTDDADGEQLSRADASGVAEDQVRAGLAALAGDVEQIPSAVSAIKIDGRRSYARVRAGEQVELKARPVRIERLELLATRRPEPELLDCDVEVECSTGTYVRAIARDLGAALGVGGHLTALRRTRVGHFTLGDAATLEELESGRPVRMSLSEAAAALFPRRDLAEADAARMSHGNPLPGVGIDGPYAVFGPDGGVLAVVVERGGLARPEAVLAPASRD
ncbi:MAG: tRNA pseudouridine(55) synthase TruB [Micromonosporaceae bacterium]|nr:tRNA pseudouridine(55) synthase TruB [Micromonosporaceae bacterium]